MKQTTPQPPAHLKSDTARWWASVLADYELQPHHVRLLTAAAECWDRASECREALAREGLVFIDRFDQPRPRPEAALELKAKAMFSRLVRELGLDIATPDDDPRPPAVHGKRFSSLNLRN